MNAAPREFTVKTAVREAVGLLLSIVGPSSAGKTYSALRLASGIQRVVGGKIYFVDTENGRALYYADKFAFEHVRFPAPFSPADYFDAIRFCAREGAKTVIVDSMSHEHEGPGGVLEMHEAELSRMAGNDMGKRERLKMLAWNKPKSQRRRLINELLQLNINLIATFRAKEKLKLERGKEPVALGWQPIGGEEFKYEFTAQMLLPPNSDGMPRWHSDFEGERAIVKLPEQFKTILLDSERSPRRLDEDLGQALAEWAAGGARKPAREQEIDKLVADYAKCGDAVEFEKLEKRRNGLWTKATPAVAKDRMKEAADLAKTRIGAPSKPDAATWIETLTAQDSLAALDDAWNGCNGAFDGMPPDNVLVAYESRREELGEAEGKRQG